MPTIKLMHNSASFADVETSATTVGALRIERDIPTGAPINVNGQEKSDPNSPIVDGDMVAAVNNNKTGG